MDYAQALWIYLLLVFGIVVVPGMDMFFVIANALTGGRSAGLSAVGGIMLGGAVHSLFGALAVGVLATMPDVVFRTMILVGALYMGWIGWTLLRSAIVVHSIARSRTRSNWVAFRQGTVTALLNPKAYLFVLAVFPQYTRPQFGSLWQQAVVLGIITVSMQFVVYGTLAIAAGRGRDALVDHPSATVWMGRATGVLFILAALFTGWQGLQLRVAA